MDTKPKTTRIHAEESPWYQFMVESAEYDRDNNKPRGYHWFWGIYYLCKAIPAFPKVDIRPIQDKLPSGYLLNETEIPSAEIIHKALMQIYTFPKLCDYINSIKYTDEISKIDFSKLVFRDSANFSDFIFPVQVSFIQAIFSKPAIFKNVKFFDLVNFTETNFDAWVSFECTKFHSFVIFCDTIFTSFTNFTGAMFFNTTSFLGTKFLSFLRFDNAVFSCNVSFDKIETKASAIFTKTQFLDRVPTFYDSKLYSNIIWDRDVKLWPQIDWSNINDEYKELIIDNQDAYENLASLMKKLDKYHDEHFFYREEMRCRRWLERNPCISFSYWLYEKLSDNGYGIGRALFWWSFHILLGAVLIFDRTKTACNKNCDLIDNFYFDLVVSFANAHGVLFFSNGPLKEYYTELKAVAGFNVIWGIQTVLGIIFLFLLLLTLRIRFRLK